MPFAQNNGSKFVSKYDIYARQCCSRLIPFYPSLYTAKNILRTSVFFLVIAMHFPPTLAHILTDFTKNQIRTTGSLGSFFLVPRT